MPVVLNVHATGHLVADRLLWTPRFSTVLSPRPDRTDSFKIPRTILWVQQPLSIGSGWMDGLGHPLKLLWGIVDQYDE